MELRVHYHPRLLARARAGDHVLTERLRQAMARCDVRVTLCDDARETRRASAVAGGHSLVLMHPPLGPRQFVLRLAYLYPFWRIERTAKRWHFRVATARFDPATVDAAEAADFCARRRRRDLGGAKPGAGDGTIYVALQGRLRDARSFQTMSPIEMLAKTLSRADGTPVVAGLHPGEDYDADDRAALDRLRVSHPNLRVITGGMQRVLPRASLVVTQNSSVALMGYFLHKPAVLFGQSDFHHIAAKVAELGVNAAFDKARSSPQDFESYLFWFFNRDSVDASAPDADAQIVAALTRCGWRA